MNTATAAELKANPLRAEALLLSTLMFHADAWPEIEGELSAEDFHSSAHAIVFTAIEAIADDVALADPTLVTEYLSRKGRLDLVGGVPGMMDITGNVSNRSNLKAYTEIVASHATMRAAERAGRQIQALADGDIDNIDDVLTQSAALVDGLAEKASRATVRTISQTLAAYRAQMDLPSNAVTTGFAELDELTGGYPVGDLTIVGAASGHGKTSLVVVSALAALKAGRPVVFNALEMSEVQLINRLVSIITGVDLQKLTLKRMTQSERKLRNQAVDLIDTWPLVVDEDPNVSTSAMKSHARHMRREFGEIGLWVFDYAQLWTPKLTKAHSRQEEVAEASRWLRRFAKNEGVALAAAVQLNNASASRSDKRPQQYDIRESAALFHDAALAVFAYRPAAYGEMSESGNENETEFIVRKQRNGPTDKVLVDWVPHMATFVGRGQNIAPDGLTPAQRLAAATGRDPRQNMGEDSGPPIGDHEETNF